MDAWEKWWAMAQGSLASSRLLLGQGEYRSSASRAYYAAYQAVTAMLLYHNMTPPEGREAWTHDATPDLIGNLSNTRVTQRVRKDVASRLESFYEVRLIADYISDAEVRANALQGSIKDASFIAKIASDVFF